MSKRLSLLPVAFAFLVACEATNFHNADVEGLIDAYRAKNAAQTAAIARAPGVQITRSGDASAIRLSATYEHAPVFNLVTRIAELGDIDISVAGPVISGQISGQFMQATLEAALRQVLSQSGYRLEQHAGTYSIHADRALWFAALASADAGMVSAEIPLSHLRAAKVVESIADMAQNLDVDLTPNAARNSLILTGDYEEAERVASVVKSLDVEPEHILVEALIVEFNLERIRDIGSELSDGQAGDFTEIFYNLVGDSRQLALSFDSATSMTSSSFSLALEFLIENSAAHVLSRPFVTTMSGETATLEITEDRFVETVVLDEAELNEVSSGVTVSVTPTALGRGDIAIDYEISESRFAATEDEVDLRRSQNSVIATAIVPDGRTIVIGGLSLKTRARTSAGLPIGTNVPLFGSLIAHEANRQQDTEVMMFVTPRIWAPGMDVAVATEQAIRDHARALD